MINNFKHRHSDSFEDTLNIGQLISEGNLSMKVITGKELMI